MRFLKALKLWQMAVLVLVLAGGAFAAYQFSGVSGTASAGGLQENEQLVPVQRGDVVSHISTSGTLTYPQKESLRLSSQSVVREVLVEEGQTVTEGQVLVRVDAATVAELEAGVARAQLARRDAQRALDTLTITVERQLDDATEALRVAESDLATVYDSQQDLIDDAETRVTDAETAYRDAYAAWLGITLTDEQATVSPTDLLTMWGIDLDAAFNRDGPTDLHRGSFSSGAPRDDPVTAWREPVVYGILNFYPADIVGTCAETDAHPPNGQCIRKGFDDPWATLDRARNELDSVHLTASKAVAKAKSGLQTAQDDVTAAREDLEAVSDGPGGYTLQLRRAELVISELNLETAIQELEDATLRAPFAGIVAQLNATAGESLGQNVNVAVEIIDTSIVELAGSIDEIDILSVSVGATVEVTLDSLPGELLTGTVSSIAAAGTSQQGIVLFPVQIRVDVPPGLVLREGLSAQARLVISQETDVLRVPIGAVYGTYQLPLLRVMADGTITERPVTLGNSDDFYVVIVDGASEGEEVIMEVIESTFGFQFASFGDGPRRGPAGAVRG